MEKTSTEGNEGNEADFLHELTLWKTSVHSITIMRINLAFVPFVYFCYHLLILARRRDRGRPPHRTHPNLQHIRPAADLAIFRIALHAPRRRIDTGRDPLTAIRA